MRRFLAMTGVAAAITFLGCGEKESADRGGAGGSPADSDGAGGSSAKPKPDTVESLYDEMEEQLDTFAHALREVRESGAPKEFARKVEHVTVELKAIASRLLDLAVPSEEVKHTLSERRKSREEEMQKSFGNLQLFLSGLDPEVRASVEETLRTFMTKMSELEEEVFARYFDAEEPPDAPTPPPAPPE